MADRPDKLPRWADTDPSYVDEPLDAAKDTGWLAAQKPPAQQMNWLQFKAYEWIAYHDALLNGGYARFVEDFDLSQAPIAADGGTVGKFMMGGSTNLTAETDVLRTLGSSGEVDLTNTGASSVTGYLSAPALCPDLANLTARMRAQVVARARLDTPANSGFIIGLKDVVGSNDIAFRAGSGGTGKWQYLCQGGSYTDSTVNVTDGVYALLEVIKKAGTLTLKINGTTVFSGADTNSYSLAPFFSIVSLSTSGPYVGVDLFAVEFPRLVP